MVCRDWELYAAISTSYHRECARAFAGTAAADTRAKLQKYRWAEWRRGKVGNVCTRMQTLFQTFSTTITYTWTRWNSFQIVTVNIQIDQQLQHSRTLTL